MGTKVTLTQIDCSTDDGRDKDQHVRKSNKVRCSLYNFFFFLFLSNLKKGFTLATLPRLPFPPATIIP